MLIVHMLAQAAAAATPEAVAAPQEGVISYPPAFFAAQQPANAHEMLLRLPGFAIETGDSVRGFEGAAGNVLIDGRRPTSKTDDLEEMLRRIPAGQVERIDLIRGGAPGIDMEGRTVMANVVRKQTGGFRGGVMPGSYFVYDGRTLTGIRAEAQWRWAGGRSAELAQVYGRGPSDELGDGVRTRYGPDGAVILRSDVDADGHGLRQWTTGAYETPFAGGRARLNGDTLDVRRAETGANIALGRGSGFFRYLWDDLDINGVKRENLDLGGEFFITQNWGITAYGNRDMVQNGWVVRDVGVVYRDECTRIEVIYRREDTIVGRLGPSESVAVRLTLATLGEPIYAN